MEGRRRMMDGRRRMMDGRRMMMDGRMMMMDGRRMMMVDGLRVERMLDWRSGSMEEVGMGDEMP